MVAAQEAFGGCRLPKGGDLISETKTFASTAFCAGTGRSAGCAATLATLGAVATLATLEAAVATLTALGAEEVPWLALGGGHVDLLTTAGAPLPGTTPPGPGTGGDEDGASSLAERCRCDAAGFADGWP